VNSVSGIYIAYDHVVRGSKMSLYPAYISLCQDNYEENTSYIA
jgi:hypothetical protein